MTSKYKQKPWGTSIETRSFYTGSKHKPELDVIPPMTRINHNEEWIGTLTEPQMHTKSQPEEFLSLDFKSQENSTPVKSNVGADTDQPTHYMIQQLLSGLMHRPFSQNLFSTSKLEPKEFVGLLLTSNQRMNEFINKLMLLMPQYDTKVARNCQILILLLKKLMECDYQVIQSKDDINLHFKTQSADFQKKEIEELQKKIQQKEGQYIQIVNQYEEDVQKLKNALLDATKGIPEAYSPLSKLSSPGSKKGRRRYGS